MREQRRAMEKALQEVRCAQAHLCMSNDLHATGRACAAEPPLPPSAN